MHGLQLTKVIGLEVCTTIRLGDTEYFIAEAVDRPTYLFLSQTPQPGENQKTPPKIHAPLHDWHIV